MSELQISKEVATEKRTYQLPGYEHGHELVESNVDKSAFLEMVEKTAVDDNVVEEVNLESLKPGESLVVLSKKDGQNIFLGFRADEKKGLDFVGEAKDSARGVDPQSTRPKEIRVNLKDWRGDEAIKVRKLAKRGGQQHTASVVKEEVNQLTADGKTVVEINSGEVNNERIIEPVLKVWYKKSKED